MKNYYGFLVNFTTNKYSKTNETKSHILKKLRAPIDDINGFRIVLVNKNIISNYVALCLEKEHYK